jgi:hypothetical protein
MDQKWMDEKKSPEASLLLGIDTYNNHHYHES